MLTIEQKIETREIADLLLAGDLEAACENMAALLDKADEQDAREIRAAVHHFKCGGNGSRIETK